MKNEGMNISEIKVLGGGLKGMEVYYSKVETGEDGRDWVNGYWTERSIPINGDLDKLVKAFRFYLYDIYGYDMEGVNEAELEILGVKSDLGSFVIKGKQKVLDGTKYVDMKTPKVLEDDGYVKYGEVVKLVGQLYKEVEVYMSGMKDTVTDVQIVMDFNKNKGLEFDEVAFRGMAVADQRDMATGILEKMGSIVIHRDEVNGEEVVDVNQVDLEVSIAEVLTPEVDRALSGNLMFGVVPTATLEVPVVSVSPVATLPSFGAVVEPVKVKVPKVVKTTANVVNITPVKPLFSAPNFGDVVEQVSVEDKALVVEDEEGDVAFNIVPVKTA